MKDVQATAFSPRKRTSRTLQHETSSLSSFSWVIFALPWISIQIPPTKINADPWGSISTALLKKTVSETLSLLKGQ